MGGDMNKNYGLLVLGLDYSMAAADEFHDWYDTEHIPERTDVPGFLNAQRWLAIDDPMVSIVTYDLQARDVLESDAYKAISASNLSPWSKRIVNKCQLLCRFECEQIVPGELGSSLQSDVMLLVAWNVDAPSEFAIPTPPDSLLSSPAFQGMRVFSTATGIFVALYQFRGLTSEGIETWRTVLGTAVPDTRLTAYEGKTWTLLLRRYDHRTLT
jgi:hypothetical protein